VNVCVCVCVCVGVRACLNWMCGIRKCTEIRAHILTHTQCVRESVCVNVCVCVGVCARAHARVNWMCGVRNCKEMLDWKSGRRCPRLVGFLKL